ncbi:MAG: zinc-dependent metalloprotease [Oligoflexus sp.]
MNKIIIAIIAISSVFACARKRPVEKRYDLEGNRWPKEIFDSEKPWLYKVTVVKNGQNAAFGFVGLQSDVQLGYFNFTQKQLQFVSAIDLYGESANADKVINAWSISHSDYHRPVIGGKVSNTETENDRIDWSLKRFFKVDWNTAKITERGSFPFMIDTNCWTPISTQMVDNSQEITNEHISFTLAVDYQIQEQCISAEDYMNKDMTHTIHYKYSFMPDFESDYQPYVYTGENDTLMKKYGYFNTVVPTLNDENRVTNNFLMNRWHPNKTHTFYFAEDFPEEYKWIYNEPEHGIMARTNKLFAERELPIRFEIADNDGTKKFGDIRYSFIKFIEENDRTAPFGYGPSDAHPRTGEIFAANTMMWTGGLKTYVRRYQEEMEREPTKLTGSSVYREMERVLGKKVDTWEESSVFLRDRALSNFYRFLVPEFTYGSSGTLFAYKENEDMVPEMLSLKTMEKFQSKYPGFVDVNRQIAVSDQTIRQQLEHYRHINRFSKSNSTIYHLSDEIVSGVNTRLQNAADPEKVINDTLYRVSIHEFGHNLNLRHNFYGSVDARIERRPGDDLTLRRTSSVMDYLSIKDEVGLVYDWEDYDKSALIYSYSNGKQDPAKELGITHLYCTDEHRAFNALCNAFDQGSTPTEIVKSLIDNYDQAYWTRNFRWDRAYWNTGYYNGSVFSTMFDMKKFVKLYQEAFLPFQVQQKMANIPNATPQLVNLVSTYIRNDIKEAVRLTAGFYSSVIKQGFLDRPYVDTYDEFQGTLKQVGIFPDKFYAAMFLMGDDSFPLNPNIGMNPVSFIPLRDDPEIGPAIDEILFDTFVNSGDAYTGFDTIGRSIYAQNAGRYFDFGGDQIAIDLMKIVCYEKTTFDRRFNLDSSNFNGPGEPLVIGVITPDFNHPDADSYFEGETQVAVVRINGKYYVAGTEKNPYSSGLITRQPSADLNGVLNTHYFYNIITGQEGQQCF